MDNKKFINLALTSFIHTFIQERVSERLLIQMIFLLFIRSGTYLMHPRAPVISLQNLLSNSFLDTLANLSIIHPLIVN